MGTGQLKMDLKAAFFFHLLEASPPNNIVLKNTSGDMLKVVTPRNLKSKCALATWDLLIVLMTVPTKPVARMFPHRSVVQLAS